MNEQACTVEEEPSTIQTEKDHEVTGKPEARSAQTVVERPYFTEEIKDSASSSWRGMGGDISLHYGHRNYKHTTVNALENPRN